MPTFTTESSRCLLQRLPLGVRAVADTHVHCRPVAAAAIIALFFCDEGGHVADGKAGEGAHHENISLVQQQGGDGVRAHAAQLVLWETSRKKFDFDTEKTYRLENRIDVVLSRRELTGLRGAERRR